MHCKNIKRDCTKMRASVTVTPLVSRQRSGEDFHGFTQMMSHRCHLDLPPLADLELILIMSRPERPDQRCLLSYSLAGCTKPRETI